ncbi:response regulator [Geomesophilobacter sediminis]|uniref:response regulator n=1 Tax=Geomesophilobacter sediminis TaxID=2798584 RepID=UPI001C071CC2|nr:response regulator transcription factor [Geomesophilobacter sediminis]
MGNDVPIKILVADDHAIIREGLKLILENREDMIVIGEARDGGEAVEKAATLHPQVIVMDLAMPGMNGIEATRLIHGRSPEVMIIILSMHHSKAHIVQALRAGARGYLLKESAGEELVQAIRGVVRGELYYGEGVEAPAAGQEGTGRGRASGNPLESLSPRELEVLQLVVEGRTSAEIGEMLSLSPKTVETYRSRLMLKLGINNLPALVKFAILHRIIPVGN